MANDDEATQADHTKHRSRGALNGSGVTKSWWLLVGLAILALGGWWYWQAQPARVHAAVAKTRSVTNRTDVMTVESISEGGATAAGRRVTIANARVSEVTGEKTFWISGSEGDPLLVIVAQSKNSPAPGVALSVAVGNRVSLNGVVVRSSDTNEPLSTVDRVQAAKAAVYLLASDVRTQER